MIVSSAKAAVAVQCNSNSNKMNTWRGLKRQQLSSLPVIATRKQSRKYNNQPAVYCSAVPGQQGYNKSPCLILHRGSIRDRQYFSKVAINSTDC